MESRSIRDIQRGKEEGGVIKYGKEKKRWKKEEKIISLTRKNPAPCMVALKRKYKARGFC